MTRPTTTAPKRGVRNTKRTPARLTAHIEYQPAGLDRSGRRVREAYHAITDQAIKIGFLTRWSIKAPKASGPGSSRSFLRSGPWWTDG
jgi:hypothetical protein